MQMDGYYTMEVREMRIKGVRILLLEHHDIFSSLYPNIHDNKSRVRLLTAYSKAPIAVMNFLKMVDPVVVTNDWSGGLTAALCKHNGLIKLVPGATFFHIFHNLDKDYEGRIYLGPFESHYPEVHHLPDWVVLNHNWSDRILNPSRAALLSTDQWGTVSKTYRAEILRDSPLSDLLHKFPKPFGYSNGIDKAGIKEAIIKKFGESTYESHLKAKEVIQKTYFGMKELDDSYILLSTIGRIVDQKQIHLVLEAVEPILYAMNFKVNIMIAGMANLKDDYGSYCGSKIWHLRQKYPNHFWADATFFFSEHRIEVFHGTDFGIMFSKFEPGGLVHLEYFSGGTLMIATRTGGLADTIEEINETTRSGTGIFITENNAAALTTAVQKAKKMFDNKPLYKALREGCYDRAIDTQEGAIAYLIEFYRLKGKIFIDKWQKRPLDLEPIQSGPCELISLVCSRLDVKRIMIKGSFDGWTQAYNLDRVPNTCRWILNHKLPVGNVQVYFLLNGDERYVDPTGSIQLDKSYLSVNSYTITA